MAQFANGKLRLAVKHSNGQRKAASPSVDYTIADNAAVPRWVLADVQFGTAQGTSDDEIKTPPANLFADGSKGEMLDLEFYHSAAATTLVTASHVVSINVADIYAVGDELMVEDLTLYIADRTTKDTSGTRNHGRGWKDNTLNVAYVWSPLVRYMPEAGHVYAPRGHQQATVDGT